MATADSMLQAAQRAEDAETAATTQERDMARRSQHELDAEARENRCSHAKLTSSSLLLSSLELSDTKVYEP